MDIRDKTYVTHEDVINLNFISSGAPYVFNYHYHQGLRSHVLQVLSPEEHRAQKEGIVKDGIKKYPRAEPHRVLRIYRSGLDPTEAMHEIQKTRTIKEYLKENVAESSEFIASYCKDGSYETVLCGLQEYIKGKSVDPWFCVPEAYDEHFIPQLNTMVERLKACISETGYIPDLAGRGNLIYSERGVVLTDINNIHTMEYYTDEIYTDDKGFPIVNASMEALSKLEKVVNGGTVSENFYGHYLEPEQKAECQRLIKEWARDDDFPPFGVH